MRIPSMLRTAVLCAPLLFATQLAGQTYKVSVETVSWPNSTGLGTPQLVADVHYPTLVPNGPIAQVPGGLPVVVMLHGYGFLGTDYAALADHLAVHGYVTVLLDTAQYSWLDQHYDARAMFGVLIHVNGGHAGTFAGALDLNRVGLMGHSMGGTVATYVLRDAPGLPLHNPGYRCALVLSPVDPALASLGIDVRVPIGIVSGAGDTVTPPALHAERLYNELQTAEGLKFHYAMDSTCDHMNVAGLLPHNPSVFVRSRRIAVSFFDQFLDDGWSGLQSVLGPEGLSDPVLLHVDHSTAVPQAWSDSPLTIGGVTELHVASEPGLVAIAAASSMAPATQTPFGELRIDSATSFLLGVGFVVTDPWRIALQVPNDPQLVGASFAMQCIGATTTAPLLLGSAIAFTVN